jgi:ketosteroid isomerase-like protein
MKSLVSLSLLLVVVGHPCVSQTMPATDAEPRQMLARWIQAFDNLDWDEFRQGFDDNATVFYPRAVPHRADGRAAFEEHFRQVFVDIRKGKSGPPYMDIRPRDLNIQMLGDVAIATFHLDDRPGFLNRRTIVLHNTPAGWKIVHLHASEVATP